MRVCSATTPPRSARRSAGSRYQLAPSLVFYAVATALGFVQPYVGLVLYVLIGVFLILPMRTVRRWLRRRG